jgi:acyl-coenzyme A synthetase/AMP-(fatty) acid ligase
MSSLARSTTPSDRLPLIGHAGPDAAVALRRGEMLDAARFVGDVLRMAQELPGAGHVLNACGDRYRFAVTLCAAALRGQLTLLPSATTPGAIRALRDFAADAYCVHDDPACDIDLPRMAFVEGEGAGMPHDAFEVPRLDGSQAVACVFTSGSTGEPQPNYKRWGSLVVDVLGEARRLGVGSGHTILGTVPPQHMYGFESTVMLPLAAGACVVAERLYFPADIDAAIARAQAPRILFTTPFHLRAWIDSDTTARIEAIVSATAPLSAQLAREAEARTGAVLREIYGCTEAGQVATRRTALGPEWDALDGIRVWNDSRGQAHCIGAHVEEATPLQDVIEVLGDGTRFLLHGRTADLVNIAGKRSSIGYLNHQLAAIPGVKDGAFYLPDDETPDGVTRLMAFVVAPGLDPATILAALRQQVDAAFLPRPIVMVDSLPRALTGKLPREALRRLAADARR